RVRARGAAAVPRDARRGRGGWDARAVLGAGRSRRRRVARRDPRCVRSPVERARLRARAERSLAGVPLLDRRPVVSGPLAALPDEELSVLDLVDRLLTRGVVITGEATISVAGVDLVYLGLNVSLTAVETIAQKEGRAK